MLEDGDGAWQAAMCDDEAAIAADPLRTEGYANLVSDLLDRTAVPTARATIRSGRRGDPADGRLRFLLACTYQFEGKPPPASRAECRAALVFDEKVVAHAARDALRARGDAR